MARNKDKVHKKTRYHGRSNTKAQKISVEPGREAAATRRGTMTRKHTRHTHTIKEKTIMEANTVQTNGEKP